MPWQLKLVRVVGALAQFPDEPSTSVRIGQPATGDGSLMGSRVTRHVFPGQSR